MARRISSLRLHGAAHAACIARGFENDCHGRYHAIHGSDEDHHGGGLDDLLALVLYQAWAFVAPGLYMHEKRLVAPLIFSSTILFILGVAFCYYLVFGTVFKFISDFAPKSISVAPDIENYLDFVLMMCLAFGLTFEVPVVVIVLVRMGIVSVEKLKAIRSYVIVGAFVIAAIVTPPDIMSQLFLAVPLCLLYEVGILLAPLFAKATQAPEESTESS